MTEVAEAVDLHACCLFIGYPRSGHSLVGSLLDAHPDMVVSHQADAMKLVLAQGLDRAGLVESLAKDSARRAGKGRRQGKYDYRVEGQWQGRARVLRVIGDCRGGKVTRRVAVEPDAAERFAEVVQLPLRFVHVVRNPYDNIATLSTRPEHTLDSAIDEYAFLVGAVDEFVERGEQPVLTVRHEDLIADPRAELRRIAEFLGVTAEDSWLDACAAIVFPSPRRRRESIEWPRSARERVDAIIARHGVLDGYSFES